MPSPLRIMLVATGLSVLLLGLWGGLLRLGSPLPDWLPLTVPHHGPLMIGGFLGTLITLERAVALGHRWCYLGPAFAGAGAWAMVFDAPWPLGPGLITLASLVLVADFVLIVRRQCTAFTVVMGLGALAWLVGNGLWLAGWVVPQLVPWWAGFLILTIVGERLELSRFMPARPGRQASFLLAAGLYGLGLLVSLGLPGLGLLIIGAGLVALSVWLVLYDVARQTVRQAALPRFVAAALLSGYGWMAVGGVLAGYYALFTPGAPGTPGSSWLMTAPMAGPAYDAILHCLLLGFVVGMIFGHAPIIFPAVLGIQMRYTPLFYSHLLLLQGTLAMRIAGDVLGWSGWRDWGGIGNVLAVLLFLGMTVSSVRRRPPSRFAAARSVWKSTSRVVPLHRPP